jgi:catechol-2,3-dioxygenase
MILSAWKGRSAVERAQHPWSRRDFLAAAAVCGAWLAAPASAASAALGGGLPDEGGRRKGPRILSLELLTSVPLSEMKRFYHDTLSLPLLLEKEDRISVRAGVTALTFVRAGGIEKPFYHFAFNIPENKLLSARSWQRERGPLMPIPERLRDKDYPEDVVHFPHWNAHSIYFFDPGGNVVEYIARHDLKNRAEGNFESRDILYASEIALVVDDVAAASRNLGKAVGVGQYRGGDDQFMAMGDEEGLLLVIRRGRTLNFNPADPVKAARVFPTLARVRASAVSRFRFPDFPYELSLEG